MMDLISREAALDCFHDWIDRRGDVHTPDEMAEYRAIEELPVVEPEKRTEERTETHACDLISRQEAIDAVSRGCQELRGVFARCEKNLNELPPAQQKLSCEGCKHLGKWENEVEYGYSSPCTRCKRRVEDHYER